jgi:hypothetical protein
MCKSGQHRSWLTGGKAQTVNCSNRLLTIAVDLEEYVLTGYDVVIHIYR